jgi:hypothetical protein
MARIQIVSLKYDYPAPLASWAEGTYEDSAWLEKHWDREPNSGSQEFLKVMKEIEGSTGDPIRFLGDEGTYIAEFKGTVGLLDEYELDETFNYPLEPLDAEREVSIAQFDRIVTTKILMLEDLSERFPFTEFFVSYGDVTHKGSICLNAYTPFEQAMVDGKAVYLSPYSRDKSLNEECPTLKQIAYLMQAVRQLDS